MLILLSRRATIYHSVAEVCLICLTLLEDLSHRFKKNNFPLYYKILQGNILFKYIAMLKHIVLYCLL